VEVRRRVYYSLAATACMIAVLSAGALTPLDPNTSEMLLSQAEQLISRAGASPLGILANNLLASLIMMIPAIGIPLSIFIVYNTGLIFSALSVSYGVPSYLLLTIPFITLYGLLEMLAYGVAVSESAVMVSAVFRRRIGRELKLLPIVVAVTAALLAVAALLEFLLIGILAGPPA
ncbi:MAG: stage II sporulation protein M, partial [Nitrososphaerota archaeon]